MDSSASPYMVPEGQAILGENVDFYRDNTLRARKGYTLGATAVKSGQFVTQRLNGVISKLYREGISYKLETNGAISNVGTASTSHNFVRTTGGVLIVQPTGIMALDSDGYYVAGVDAPLQLTGSPTGGGKLKEGVYTYTHNYLLKGGFESPTSPELSVTVPGQDYKVTLTVPVPTSNPKMFKLRIYRKGPSDGVPLLIAELEPNVTSFVDSGDQAQAVTFVQGNRPMPGGQLALIHNRRLFVVDGNTMNYSYPGQFAYSNVFWTEKVNLPTGEPIRAICPLGQGVIFFGLETAIFMNGVPAEGGTFNPIPVPDGCVSQTAWTTAEDGTLIYVGKSGVYAMQGAASNRISDVVNNYFRKYTVGQLAQTTIIYDQQERRLLVALPGEILVYHFQTQAWAVWTLDGASLDWFEGRIYLHMDDKFGVLGEASNDNGSPITGRFISGVHGLEDNTTFKLFRRMGLQLSASPTDTVSLSIRTLENNNSYGGLPPRDTSTPYTWDNALWDSALWSGNKDSTQTIALPDNIQGRYIQFNITFTTNDADQFVIMGPVVFEYRARYRYGRV